MPSTSALGPGQSAVITADGTTATSKAWSTFTVSWTCSVPSDPRANVLVTGSADGTTFFPLRPDDGFDASATGTAARFYRGQPVTAVQVTARCSPGNTVTASAAGN